MPNFVFFFLSENQEFLVENKFSPFFLTNEDLYGSINSDPQSKKNLIPLTVPPSSVKIRYFLLHIWVSWSCALGFQISQLNNSRENEDDLTLFAQNLIAETCQSNYILLAKGVCSVSIEVRIS